MIAPQYYTVQTTPGE